MIEVDSKERDARPTVEHSETQVSEDAARKSREDIHDRKKERDRREEWTRSLEAMPDRALLDEINQRIGADQYDQRCLKNVELDPLQVSKILERIAGREEELRAAKDVWADRKGLKRLSDQDLQTKRTDLKDYIELLEQGLQRLDPQKQVGETARAATKIKSLTIQLRILDEAALGLDRSTADQTFALIEKLDREQSHAQSDAHLTGLKPSERERFESEAKELSRQLGAVREAWAGKLGLKSMKTDQLQARRASLMTRRSSLLAKGGELAGEARDTAEETTAKNEQLREIDDRLRPVVEEIGAIEKILDLRANGKPLP